MKIQKNFSRKNKQYPKFIIVIPKDIMEKSGLKEGDELEVEVKEGEILLKEKTK